MTDYTVFSGMVKWLTRTKWFIHIVFWLLLVFALNIVFEITITQNFTIDGKTEPIIFEIKIVRVLIIGLAFKVALFYTNSFYLLPVYFKSRKYARYLFSFTVLLAACFFFERAVTDYYYYLTKRISNGSVRFYLLKVNVLIYLFVATISFLYYFIKEWISVKLVASSMREQQLVSRLQVLNYQINPHFLFNILNNFYALSQGGGNSELSQGISMLSDIMRYILYECDNSSVCLSKELMYVMDYIGLCKLRFSRNDSFSVSFDVIGDPDKHSLVPMILIPLVENAFKHGVHPAKRSYIDIATTIRDGRINFSIVNSNHGNRYNKIEKVSSIGLENLKERLSLVYNYDYALIIEEKQESFSIILNIPDNVN